MTNKLLKYSKFLAAGLIAALVFTLNFANFNNNLKTPIASAAAVDYYLQIDGIDGESTDAQHRNQIEILSFSWGQSNPGITNQAYGAGFGGSGKANFQDISFTSSASKASPKLMLAAATGQHIKSAKLFVRKAGERQQDFYKIELQDVLVSSYQASGQGGSIPTDSFSLNFTKIQFEYSPQGADGTLDTPIKAGYDIKANKKI